MLKNQNIFISGSYGHLGEKIAINFAKQSANLILNGRKREKLNLLKKKIHKNYDVNITLACFDIASENKVKDFFLRFNNKIDVLINNAHSSKMGDANIINAKDFEKTLKTNLIGASNLIKHSFNSMKRTKENFSSIINISSIYSVVSPYQYIYDKNNVNSFSYGSSKAALNQLSKYFAVRYAKNNIKVNSIILGAFPSDEYIKKNKKITNKLIQKIPVNRFGEINDIMGPIIYLSTDLSNYVTGTELVVDGGWTAW